MLNRARRPALFNAKLHSLQLPLKKQILLCKRGERNEGTGKKDMFLSLSANVRLTTGLGEPMRLGLAVREGGRLGR
jgi:hypothetical protein